MKNFDILGCVGRVASTFGLVVAPVVPGAGGFGGHGRYMVAKEMLTYVNGQTTTMEVICPERFSPFIETEKSPPLMVPTMNGGQAIERMPTMAVKAGCRYQDFEVSGVAVVGPGVEKAGFTLRIDGHVETYMVPRQKGSGRV